MRRWWYQSRFYFAWTNRCWHCLLNPMHPTTKRVQRMIEEERVEAIQRAHLRRCDCWIEADKPGDHYPGCAYVVANGQEQRDR